MAEPADDPVRSRPHSCGHSVQLQLLKIGSLSFTILLFLFLLEDGLRIEGGRVDVVLA